jgi:ribosomal protein S10
MKLKISIKAPSNENLYGLLASFQHIGFSIDCVGLPKHRRRWALLRSPHVNSKSRLHYEFILSKYRLEIKIPSSDVYKIFRLLHCLQENFTRNMIVKVQIQA